MLPFIIHWAYSSHLSNPFLLLETGDLAKGAVTYLGAGIGIACTAVFGDAPDCLKDCKAKAEEYNKTISAIIHDPFLIVEGLSQSINDAYEEKGICYVTGYAVGEVAQLILLKKAGEKLSKSHSAKKVAKDISKGRKIDMAKEGDIISKAKKIRENLPSRYKKSGNLATAQVEVEGISQKEFFAHSGIDEVTEKLAGKVDGISVKPQNAKFKATKAANKNGEIYVHDACTEYKIINDIADRLKNTPNASGTIKLFTELEPCTICQNIITKFQLEFKNIKIEVIHNGNIRIIPKNGY